MMDSRDYVSGAQVLSRRVPCSAHARRPDQRVRRVRNPKGVHGLEPPPLLKPATRRITIPPARLDRGPLRPLGSAVVTLRDLIERQGEES